jgi:hypothetical protein
MIVYYIRRDIRDMFRVCIAVVGHDFASDLISLHVLLSFKFLLSLLVSDFFSIFRLLALPHLYFTDKFST